MNHNPASVFFSKLAKVLIPSNSTIVLILLLLFGFLAMAVIVELYRRRREQQERLLSEWRMVREIIEEKAFSDDEKRVVMDLIRTYSPGDVLRTITVRQHFDACVAAAMRDLVAKEDRGVYESTGILLREIRVRLGLDYIPLGQRIQTTREINVGQVIWVAHVGESPPQWVRAMVSAVDESYLYLTGKEDEEELPALTPGVEVRCRLWREEDARYLFTTTLARCDGPRAWLLTHTSDLARTQSRAYFRVRHDQTTMLGIVNAPVTGTFTDLHERPIVSRIRGRITSVSAGGVALVSQMAIPRQVLLRIALHLPDAGFVEVDAKVVSAISISGGRYLVRCAFLEISEDKREKIARYVLSRQQPLFTPESISEKPS